MKTQNLQELVGTGNQLFQNLKSKVKISDKQLKYFTYEHKKVSNLGKLYILLKIDKRLHIVPGRPVISNCGTPTEKASEFLDYYLKLIMRRGKSYIKDSGDFIKKLKACKTFQRVQYWSRWMLQVFISVVHTRLV